MNLDTFVDLKNISTVKESNKTDKFTQIDIFKLINLRISTGMDVSWAAMAKSSTCQRNKTW